MPLCFSPVAQFHQCQPVADFFLSLSVTECLQVRVVLSRRHPTRSSLTHYVYGLTCWLKRIKIHKLESRCGTPLELDTVTQHSTVWAMLMVRWLGANWWEWSHAFLKCTHRVEGYRKWVRSTCNGLQSLMMKNSSCSEMSQITFILILESDSNHCAFYQLTQYNTAVGSKTRGNVSIGRFSEAGWLEWMCLVIFCARSRKRSQGRFLSRCSFTLCITVDVEPRIAKQYKCRYCCSCKIYRGKGMEGVKKSVFASFLGWPEDREFIEKMYFGTSYSTSNKLLLIARHIMTTGLQKCL